MTERRQPVNLGTDEKGELIWGFVPMAEWQQRLIQAIVPIPYVGDFIAFWMKMVDWDKRGKEADPKIPNMVLRRGHHRSKKPMQHHPGD